MPKIQRGVLIAIAASLLSLMFAAVSQGQTNCAGKWSHLAAYAGSYDTAAVLNDSDVKRALAQLLGAANNHLLTNLSVRGMVDLVSCNLVIEGNAEHGGGEENALLVIDMISGAVTAGILSGGKIKIYTSGDDYSSVPVSLKDWIAVIDSKFNFRFDPPANAEVISIKPE